MLQPQRLDCYGLEWTGVALGWTCIGQWMDQLRIQDLDEVWPLKPQTYWEVRSLVATASELKSAEGQILMSL